MFEIRWNALLQSKKVSLFLQYSVICHLVLKSLDDVEVMNM